MVADAVRSLLLAVLFDAKEEVRRHQDGLHHEPHGPDVTGVFRFRLVVKGHEADLTIFAVAYGPTEGEEAQHVGHNLAGGVSHCGTPSGGLIGVSGLRHEPGFWPNSRSRAMRAASS